MLKEVLITLSLVLKSCFKGRSSLNGGSLSITVGQVYEKYRALHMPSVTELTRTKKEERFSRVILPALSHVRLANLTPAVVTDFIQQLKKNYQPSPFAKRYSFKKELQDLKEVLSWWKNFYDLSFENPVRSHHFGLSVIEQIPERERRISIEDTQAFFQAFSSEMMRDLAITAWFCGGRIGEVGGIQVKNIDFKRRRLIIREVITWVKGKPRVKAVPKNGKTRGDVYLNDTLVAIFKRRIEKLPPGCSFLFPNTTGKDGYALRYSTISSAYNVAWKKAGLGHQYSGTHAIRFGASQAVRFLTGSLDAAASFTGQSAKMAEYYSKIDSAALNQRSTLQMEKALLKAREKQTGAKKSPDLLECAA